MRGLCGLGVLSAANHLAEEHFLRKLVVEDLVIDQPCVGSTDTVVVVDCVCDVLRLERMVQSTGYLRRDFFVDRLVDLGDGGHICVP